MTDRLFFFFFSSYKCQLSILIVTPGLPQFRKKVGEKNLQVQGT